jgi:hypothetical protein
LQQQTTTKKMSDDVQPPKQEDASTHLEEKKAFTLEDTRFRNMGGVFENPGETKHVEERTYLLEQANKYRGTDIKTSIRKDNDFSFLIKSARDGVEKEDEFQYVLHDESKMTIYALEKYRCDCEECVPAPEGVVDVSVGQFGTAYARHVKIANSIVRFIIIVQDDYPDLSNMKLPEDNDDLAAQSYLVGRATYYRDSFERFQQDTDFSVMLGFLEKKDFMFEKEFRLGKDENEVRFLLMKTTCDCPHCFDTDGICVDKSTEKMTIFIRKVMKGQDMILHLMAKAKA